MKNKYKGKNIGIRLAIILVLLLTLASVGATNASNPPLMIKTFFGGQVSHASSLGADVLSTEIGNTEQLNALDTQQEETDCDNLPPDADHGKKIKCKSEELIKVTCAMTGTLALQADLGVLTQAQEDEFNKTCDFATEMVKATDETEFKSLGMKRSAEGVAEYLGPDDPDQGYTDDGDSDGVCLLKKGGPKKENCTDPQGCKPKKYEEWCAEDNSDGIGDDDGFCEWQGKGQNSYLEPCVPLSGLDAIDSQEENFNEDKLVAVENALDNNISTMRAANIQLTADLEELRALQGTSAEIFTEYEPKECVGLLHVPEFDDRFSYLELWGTLTAMTSTAGGHDACDSAANQDVLGANGSAVCVATAILKGLSAVFWENFELMDDTITATRLDNAVQCLETVAEKLEGIADGVDQANLKLDTVLDNHDKLLELRRVHLQVTELKEKSEFLVAATEAGKPVSGVEFTAVKVADSSLSFVDVTENTTINMVEPGMYLVVIDLPKEVKDAELYAFEVRHNDANGDHYGFIQFHRGFQNNSGSGQ